MGVPDRDQVEASLGKAVETLRTEQGISRDEAESAFREVRSPSKSELADIKERLTAFGAEMRQLRIERGLTELELAGEAKVSLDFVISLEAGEVPDPPVAEMMMINLALGGDLHRLLSD